jgi:hypothetical protein
LIEREKSMREFLLLERVGNGTVAGEKVNISRYRAEINPTMAGSKNIKGSDGYSLIKRPLAPFPLRTASTEKVGFSSVSGSIWKKKVDTLAMQLK